MNENKCFNFTKIKALLRYENRKFKLPDWCSKKNYSGPLFSEAVHDAEKAFKSGFSLLRKGYVNHFKIQYKTKNLKTKLSLLKNLVLVKKRILKIPFF